MTKVIIGNDHLVPWRAQVDLNSNTLRFAGRDIVINISSEQPRAEGQQEVTARTREAFVLKAGHQAAVPIILYPAPRAELYYIDSGQAAENVFVARSVGNAAGPTHHALIWVGRQ